MSDIVERLRGLEDFYLKRPVAAVAKSMTEIGPLEAQTIVDYAREAADEITRLRSLTTWRPIAEAPEDGSWYIIIRDGEADSYEVGCFDPLMHDRYEHVEGGLYRKVTEKIYDYRGFNNHRRATHFLPLPPPPETKT